MPQSGPLFEPKEQRDRATVSTGLKPRLLVSSSRALLKYRGLLSYLAFMQKTFFSDQTLVQVRSLFVGQRLNLKALENTDCLGTDPLIVKAGEQGCAVLFPYGAAVVFGLKPMEEAAFLSNLQSFVQDPFSEPETEEAELYLDPNGTGKMESGRILLSEFSLQRLQIVADILAKSVVLAHYEQRTSRSFDQIAPFAASLQGTTWGKRQSRELLRQLGNTLSIQHKMMGQVEIVDKPELLWEYPELDRLYLRLEDEYEIRERHMTLERKLGLVSRTAETALDLLQHNTSLRVEWYIVLLIVAEILLSVYELFWLH